eukprot:gene34065-biopygen9256
MPYVDTFIGRLLVKIFTDFARDPACTKFLLVLPHKPHAVWWGLTKKLEELQTYSKGSVIFSASKDQCYRVEELTESEPGRVWIQGTPWAVTLFYLDQFTVGRIDAKVLVHLRLGHLCDRYIGVMDIQGVNLGVSSEELRASEVTKCSEQCMSCQVSKVTRPSQTMDRGRVPKLVRKTVEKRQASTRLGQLTFTDHGGPFQISLGGSRGYTIHVDDYSGLGCIYFWKRKLEYLPALHLYRDLVRTTGRAILGEDLRVEELVYDLDLLVIQSDNDSTIIAGQMAEYCTQNSILQRTTAPYLHENNARVESFNRLLQAKARAMLPTGGLCAGMWPLAFRHAVYLLNRVVKAELGMMSTMDVLHQKVDLSTLLALEQQMYDVLAPVSFFLEQSVSSLELLKKILNEQTINRFYPVFAFAKVQLTPGTEWEEAVVCTNARGEHRLPYQVLLLRHYGRTGKSVDVAETIIRFQVQHVALAAVQQQWLPNGVTCPKNWPQLVSAPDAVQWQASDYKEECALIDVKHAIVPVKSLPAGVKSLGMKAVYKPKFDAANVLTERKSRWVVFGNKQTHGVNYEEVYSLCTQLNTLRILIQLSLILGLLAFTMDVVTCFLNGDLDLDAPLFVRWPDNRLVRGTYFGRLAKSVYGLKQAPRVWYFTLKRWLLQYHTMLAVSNIDPCLFYIFRPNELIVFIYIHVDNFLILTSSETWKNNFFTSFNSTYPSVDEGVLTDILGMRMTFRDAGLVRECRMSQQGLIHRILERYGMSDCNPALSPMEPKLSLTPADPQETAADYPYANLATELMWLARCTRPDILTAVCYMARFMHCFNATHWQHLLRILRYLKGTVDDCLTLQCSSPASHIAELEISAYLDADHAADKVTRRSVTGSLVRLNGSTVMYSSKLQRTIAVSTADGELVALSETARDIEHVINLLSEFAPVKLPVVLHGDNHASVIQAESALNNTATRHISVRDRYVAKLAELGRILIAKVPSAENLADFFT